MAKRNSLNQHNIKNLYIKKSQHSKTGYSCQYRDPRFGDPRFPECTKQYHGLGSDIAKAKEQATTLNALIYAKIATEKVNSILAVPANVSTGIKLGAWIDEYITLYEAKLARGEVKPNTIRTKFHIVKTIRAAHGDRFFSDITVRDISALLDKYISQDKSRMAQSVRSVYSDVYKQAIGKGVPGVERNIAQDTINPVAKVKRERLSLEHFIKIRSNITYAPHSYASLLALVTGQRLVDLTLIRVRKGADWDDRYKKYRQNPNHFVKGAYGSHNQLIAHAPYSFVDKDTLCIFQLKTGNLLRIPLDLRLKAIDISVGDVIEEMRLVESSEMVLHHNSKRTLNEIGGAVHMNTVSRAFAKARDLSELQYILSPPTFHEIRSLSERLYREQGVNTQKLLGHKKSSMTDIYNDARGCDWSSIEIV